ncbi:hypothetical protein ElP_28540 [Tautonia plasticadhaerens]|uniref:Uncharacterized protein n=2 Tax=Tautonia plasticadhaerens TaxID=2527974 RepID=A0A518H2B6_9BACT|nr:hypothetical protein ElP_28540 [Tautonia plasticadhaerens]
MGLDMYLTGEKYFHGVKRKRGDKKGERYDLGYWRKHPNLHGFIVKEFAGGEDECQPIYLDKERMERIIAAVEAEQLPHTTGFFFGASDGSEKEEDLAIFREAIAWLEEEEEGVWRSVVYQASW